MQRYGIACDVWINVGKKSQSYDGREQELMFRGNRKFVNQNAEGLLKKYREVDMKVKKESNSGLRQKQQLKKQMEEVGKGVYDKVMV